MKHKNIEQYVKYQKIYTINLSLPWNMSLSKHRYIFEEGLIRDGGLV